MLTKIFQVSAIAMILLGVAIENSQAHHCECHQNSDEQYSCSTPQKACPGGRWSTKAECEAHCS